jgi:phospholipid/cholesterol/gamma-HCH transport system substrate-binding protein
MKISIEAKIGIIGIVTLAVLIWGINYLKGRNILASSINIEAYLDDAQGLENSTPVLMNGIKIGYVRSITLRTEKDPPIKCELAIHKSYPIGSGSMAVIHSADLLGTKAIRIESAKGAGVMTSGDTIRMISEPDMLTSLQSQLSPIMDRVGSLAVSMDSLASSLEATVGSDNIRLTLENLRGISASLDQALQSGGSLDQSFSNIAAFTETLSEQEEELSRMTQHFSSFSEQLDNARIDQLSENLIVATDQFKLILAQISSGEGTAGRLIYSDSLYRNLEILVTDLDLLIRDLNENPQDYVHFSLFGKSQKEKQREQEE